MRLSLEKRFLFVHVPKTAGISIGAALLPFCVDPERTAWRRVLSHLPVREDPARAWLRIHARAGWIRLKIGRDLYDDLFRFAVVRDPFDRAVSHYRFLRRTEGTRRHADALNWSFRDFLDYLARKNRLAAIDQTSWLVDRGGRVIVDRVLRFESLAGDFAEVARRIGVPETLPRRNAAEDSVEPRALYGAEERRLIETIFARDLERFDYRF